MKIIAIGDIHGRDTWKKIAVDAFDKIVFIGDYVDSRLISEEDIINNFMEIIALKKTMPDKVVLILGNHDVHYMFYPHFTQNGFMKNCQEELTELFVTNKDLFQVAYQMKNYLFTHAGVSKTWYGENLKYFGDNPTSVSDILNDMYHDEQAREVLFQAGSLRGGTDSCGGIVWADKSETDDDYLFGYHQIVGHTKVSEFERYEWANLETSITYIDVLTVSDSFYEIEI
jgi:Calcineurin-like phosphoesterase